MIRALRLLLPALIPSWAFFKAVEPSPRVQWRLLSAPNDTAPTWQEFRPRPAQISPLTILIRLIWNPKWNESLYVVSLSERLMITPTEHSVAEILRCLAGEVRRSDLPHDHAPFVQFQIVFVARDQTGISETITYIGEPCLLEAIQ